MIKPADFSRIAFAYDFLANLVFGGAIKKSQTWTFSGVRKMDSLLIIGGGTGWILKELDQLNDPLKIFYAESSPEMMRRSMNRKTSNLNIRYLENISEEEIINMDCVMLFFYLDLYNLKNLNKEISQVRKSLKSGGLLLFADFQLSNYPNRIWQEGLSYAMHIFFRLTSQIESSHLKDMDSAIQKNGFKLKAEKYFYGKFITGKIYQKE